jgi:DNA adenine methylase
MKTQRAPARLGAVRPVAPYRGGKKLLAKRLCAAIDAVPHELYAEPFFGMGGVFLRRRQPARIEIINDANRDVATFFRVLQRHYVAFLEMMRWQLTTRAEFERLCATRPETLTDLERAARFLYLQRTAFGGKVAGQNFGMSRSGPARFNVTRLVPMLEEVHERLAGVVIECLTFDAFIRQYDRAGALFYCDPPYWGCETDYGKGLFAREDFERLAELLAGIKGRFILSLNDVAAVRCIFARFRLQKVTTSYILAGSDQAKRAAELIITGPARARESRGGGW